MTSIAIVVPELLPVPPTQGGAIEHWVHEVTGRMAQEDRGLTVVSRPAGIAGAPGVRYIGIPWTTMEKLFHRVKEQSGRMNPLRHAAKIQNVWSYGRRVARAVRGFDVVYLHNEPNILLFLEKRANQKIVLHMHNDHLSIRAFRALYRRALAKADVVLCVSQYILHRAVENFPEHAQRFKVILNATDAATFKPYGEEALTELEGKVSLDRAYRHLLYVGRLTQIKGVHVLIAAFREVLKRNPQTRLIITGSSFFGGAASTPYEKNLVELAAPVGTSIVFTGFLAHTTLKYLYSAADIVVVPSTWPDPCPLVVFEAMASGSCVVGAAVGGIPEIIDDQRTGMLVPPNDAGALAEAICKLLSGPVQKQAMEQAARTKALTDYTWERLIAQIRTTFGELA